ncbi:DUF1566 domain-containing protein [Vibrio cholerae]|uniref:Lcl C-terminal domain-containing protein n=1 Tax=Vibrio cholerae TaxID=666 RepID=UPI0011578B12|nr:DUF1566 domain-containing protein [Vibrio cholerae]EJL6407792.1 DUF1566 domain-containing protein [Vibrio cholerae]EJL6708902.1 DUF1566 domain-containing protein [Vibrio cholerae]EJL9428011.1 DUF1566 domain-containing protein [Vibrio cholerae]EKF9876072.1 DUF1566 domain-containing protein [Vibrio cholerae]TQO60994.1 DUF1566 domain-containing protein [Vibrio cholerae]
MKHFGATNAIWRLPTIDELESLLSGNRDERSGCWESALNQSVFPNKQSGSPYWSSTSDKYLGLNVFAWSVDFVHGDIHRVITPAKAPVRLVRNGVINQRYLDQLDGTVLDFETNLVWMRCSYGQNWNGKTCIGEAQKISWHDAIKLTYNFAGSTAWRLPTVEELDSLVYCSKGRKPSARPNGEHVAATDGECIGDNYQRPTINISAFPNTQNGYWSSSPHAYYGNLAWSVYFNYGNVSYYYKNKDGYGYPVRLVRDAK